MVKKTSLCLLKHKTFYIHHFVTVSLAIIQPTSSFNTHRTLYLSQKKISACLTKPSKEVTFFHLGTSLKVWVSFKPSLFTWYDGHMESSVIRMEYYAFSNN